MEINASEMNESVWTLTESADCFFLKIQTTEPASVPLTVSVTEAQLLIIK
jgi:hypothetical protein